MPLFDRWRKAPPKPTETALATLPAPTPSSVLVDGAAGRRTPPRSRGWSGTSIYSGRITGIESNPDLRDTQWPRVATDMMRTDDAIGAAWEATGSTLLSARWVWEAGDETSAFSRRLADDANALFGFGGYPGRMHRPWEAALSQAVTYFPVGFAFAEVEWECTGGRVDIADPWVDRAQSSLDRWCFDDRGGWVGVEQAYPTGDGTRYLARKPLIPADELILLTRGQTGSNLAGCGALRPIYHAFKRKRDLLDLHMIATERWAVGVPELVIDDRGAMEAGVSVGELALQVEAVRTSIGHFLRGDSAHIETTPYVRIQQYGGTLDPSALLSMIEQCDKAIMMGFLLQFLNLGSTNTGSRSVGEVHQETWRRSLIGVLDKISAAYSGAPRPGGGVIGRWASYNHGFVDPSLLPRLKHSGLDVDPLVDLLTRAPHLASSTWLVPELADRNALRRRVGLDPEVEAPDEGGEL